MRLLALTALLSLTACEQAAPPPPDNATAEVEAKPAAPPAAPFTYSRESDLLEFSYAWPSEVSAVPELVRRFTRQLGESQAKLAEVARIDRRERERAGATVHAFLQETMIESDGQSPRLLSLSIAVAQFTGGAHSTYGTNALLWDRPLKQEIKLAALFTDPANRDRVLLQRWCDALGAERMKRRAGMQADGPFNDCPTLDEIAVIPTDKDDNGRFERLTLIASPYVAGPFSEGYYQIELRVDAALVSVLKSEYRSSFQPQ